MSIRLQILSDCHLEFNNYIYEIPETDADIICLLGDIGVGLSAYKWAIKQSELLNKDIVMINGNHELYNNDLSLYEQAYDYTKGTKVHFLENDIFIYKDYRFLGCTLWSDFEAYGPVAKTHALLSAPKYISDYSYIRGFTPEQ